MNKNNIYYDHLVNKVEYILYNKGYSPYSLGYCVVKGIDEGSYYIQDLNSSSAKESYNNSENIKSLLKDFKNHLINNRPFKLLYNNEDYLYTNFFNRLSDYLFEVRDNNYSSQNSITRPTIEELTKILKCFEEVIPTVVDLIKGLPKNYSPGDPFNTFVPIILSIHNKNIFSNKEEKHLKKMISDEIDSLTSSFSNETDLEIVKALKGYLSNKYEFISNLNHPNFESGLFDTIQYIIDSKYWAEISECLPSLKLSKNKKVADKDLFEIDHNPIFHFNLNRQEILNVSPSVITDRDFNKMISLVSDIINSNKPDSIDFIQTCEVHEEIKVIILGMNMTQDLSFKIGKLFEKMIGEYNSCNVIKQSHYHEDSEIDKKNKEYLSKAAQVHWLSLELEAPNNNVKRKTNKL